MLRLYDFLKLAFGAAMAVTPLWSDVSQTATAVDVELVLAVDISGSMDRAKLEIQRQGYVNAFRQMEFSKTVKSGAIGKIAVVYMEWAGARYQKVLVPWTIIAGADDAGQFADRLAAEPYDQAPQPNRGTSISGALLSSAELFAKFGSSQARRVVDISGDGMNNSGMPLTVVRDTLVAQGITINGLPLAVESNPSINYWPPDPKNLDVYFKNCVIGGPGSFALTVSKWDQFDSVLRQKLLSEIVASNLLFIPASVRTTRQPYDCSAPGEQPGR